MKQKMSSRSGQTKLLLLLPFIALIICAFTTRGISSPSALPSENAAMAAKKGKVTGRITTVDGKSLQGVTVVVIGTSNGSITDADGNFILKGVPQDGMLAVSHVGMKSLKVKPDLDQPLKVSMDTMAVGLQKIVVHPAPDTEPLSVINDEFGITIKGIIDNNPPLYVLDGKVIERSEFNRIGPDNIETVSVLKDSAEIRKYGEKGKNGILIITSKKTVSATAPAVFKMDDIVVPAEDNGIKKKFTIVEQMPQFPGGDKRLNYYLSTYTKYPKQAKADKLEGTVVVSFMVGKTGKVDRVKVVKGVNSLLDDEALRAVLTMPYWAPAVQNGIPAEVYYTVPIEFSLQQQGANAPGSGYLNEQTAMLQEQLADLQIQMSDYQNQVTDLQKSMTTSQNQDADREKQTARLQKEMAGLQQQLTDYHTLTVDLQKQLENPQNQNTDAQKQIADLKMQMTALQSQITDFGNELNNMQAQFLPVPYRQAEVMPKFPGGEVEMMKFIRTRVKYPAIAQNEGAAGTALVRFIVSSSGKIADAAVLNDIHPSLKAEALRVIRIMPAWAPGKQAGKAVNVACTIPFSFILQSDAQKSYGNRAFQKGDFPEIVVVGTTKPAGSYIPVKISRLLS
jgi:TonB family protein